MTRELSKWMAAAAVCALPVMCQEAPVRNETSPVYRVTVVERSVDAVNYQHGAGPTRVDFRGTVLLPQAKGSATVESQRGRTEIDAKFDNLEPPQRFGNEYLTYVLWAISPEGAPHNLGEIVPGSSNHGNLHVTTELQVFGLIVTAEPYSSVRQPGDVVVLENHVRPDTIGRTQPIQAKYELMPRGHYTYQVLEGSQRAAANTPKVSMGQYEATLEIYEAQNAIGLARAAHAQQYAPNTLAKAEQAYAEAQRLQSTKAGHDLVVDNAREAAETAEDARVIAERHKQDDQLAKAQAAALQAEQAKTQAEAAAISARNDAAAAQAQAEADREARDQAESQAKLAQQRFDQQQAQPSRTVVRVVPAPSPQISQIETRSRLLERLNGLVITRDTPHGLVVTLNDSNFSGGTLRPQASETLSRVAAILAPQGGLHIVVEGYSDSAGAENLSERRAGAVRSALLTSGVPANEVSAEGLGNSRPIVSNATESGRIANRRVEIEISGDPVGTMAIWDRPYALAPAR